MLRLNVNIVIVAMVNYTAIPHTNVTAAEECGYDTLENNTETSHSVGHNAKVFLVNVHEKNSHYLF